MKDLIINESELIFQQINDINDIYFNDAVNIYEKSFPANEKQSLSLIIKRIKDTTSVLFVGLFNEKVVCMAMLWDFKDSEFTLLDYLAVDEHLRNKKIGTFFFRFLKENSNGKGKYIIIESEDYKFGSDNEIKKKRINFYLKNGSYVLDDIHYIMPSLNDSNPTEMILMICPKYKIDRINVKCIEKLIKQLYLDLYNRPSNDKLLCSIIENLPTYIKQSNNSIL